MDKLSKNKLEDMTVLLRRLWLHWNDFVFGKRQCCPKVLLKTTSEVIAEYKVAQSL